MADAQPGQTIVVLPGTYRFDDKIRMRTAGTIDHPITVQARQPGQAFLQFETEEGFAVSRSNWIFENLQITGVCANHDHCEHAFHVYGDAQHIVIRNNLVTDFNAHIKVNGLDGAWPDDGLVQFNTLTNSTPRNTNLPVTPIDMVGANSWLLADNVIRNFVKTEGNRISYGLFMKGAGRGGRVERNVIICTTQDMSAPGVRVGMSFGGGGTDAGLCRTADCRIEFREGTAVNNIVTHCNDFGVDVNRSSSILIANNTLVNTAGIDVRNESASAKVYGNLLEGRIQPRNGGKLELDMNEQLVMKDLFVNADELNFACIRRLDNIPSIAAAPRDFYEMARSDGTMPGALGQCAQQNGLEK